MKKEELIEYHMDQKVKDRLTDKVLIQMRDSLNQTFKVYERDEEPNFLNFYVFVESTEGWKRSFKTTCLKNGLPAVYDYYKKLPWMEKELFDEEVALMMVERGIIEEGSDEE